MDYQLNLNSPIMFDFVAGMNEAINVLLSVMKKERFRLR